MKQEFPKVTIVTVTYNAEKFVEETIKSVIEQDYPNIEYIIIDGGSSDGTVDIIKKYESHLAYWISESDSGIYDAMNKGIDAATGVWINFMNAGDTFSEFNVLSHLKNYFNKELSFFYGGVNFVGEDQVVKAYNPPLDFSVVYKKMPCCHQSVFTRMSVMKQFKFNTSFKINADLDFLINIYTRGHKYEYIDYAVSNFLSEGGIHTQDVPRGFLDELYVTSRYMKDCKMIYEHNAYKSITSYDFTDGNNKVQVYNYFNKIYQQVEKFNSEDYKIVLYGNSSITKMISSLFCKKPVIVDRSIGNCDDDHLMHPEDLKKMTFDFILITLIDREDEIESYLFNEVGVAHDKIKRFDL
jgi:glycosyltransferase involved in cell wall biosynthesis